MSDRIERVASIMDSFGARTGLTSNAAPRRYLWTDAFAVCSYIALHHHTGAPEWLDHARSLVHQVHHVLGRHRADDPRTGWISGLDEPAGERHPTAGGLRIGKRLPDRGPAERQDERLEWERDGQYYHYLTRWMHALERMYAASGDAEFLRHAVELAKAAHRAFAHRVAGEPRLYWKMSVDLTRPVVASMGQHDALDGFVILTALRERAEAARLVNEGDPELETEWIELAEMCRDRQWATPDALGIGGLLTDAWLLAQLVQRIPGVGERLLARCLRDAARSLDLLSAAGHVHGAADRRLPFRELGLSIGLAAMEQLEEWRSERDLPGGQRAAAAMQPLLRHVPLRRRIEAFWEQPASRTVESWTEHEDINAVMFATSLLPEGYLGLVSLEARSDGAAAGIR